MARQLEGVADLTAQLNELGVKVTGRELKGTAKVAMEEALHVARQLIPVGEQPHTTYKGRLVSGGFSQASLRLVSRVNKKTGSAEAILGVAPEAFYAAQFVELGTSKMPARPWLRPALEQSQEPILQKVADELRRRMERIAKRRAAGKKA